MTGGLLDRILAAADGDGMEVPSFALVHRPGHDPDAVDVLAGEPYHPATLDDVRPPPRGAPGTDRPDTLVVVPYRQIGERGFAHVDDGTPLVAMPATDWERAPLAAVRAGLPDRDLELSGAGFDPSDEEYTATVRRVLDEEIGAGEGANFVIRRSFVADVGDWSTARALSVFGRMLSGERDAYWTFVVRTPETTLVGASPELHVSLRDGLASMNPISGTYRYGPDGPDLDGLLRFLDDTKEADELYMVLDEELKMMAGICRGGGRVRGPHLHEMSRLAHTGYVIDGRTGHDPVTVLRRTLLAPTVTGSPLESSCRAITRHEPDGRGYYAGVVGLIGRDAAGGSTLDSAILIRTAEVDRTGRLRIGVGSTLVRDSEPDGEVAETRAKAQGVLSALRGVRLPATRGRDRLAEHPAVRTALAGRNGRLSRFWLTGTGERDVPHPGLAGRTALICDVQDEFTGMLGHQLRALGLEPDVRPVGEHPEPERYDAVVLGPGPGDPRGVEEERIARLWETTRRVLERRVPFLAVCLSHQVLSLQLGLDVVRRDRPSQGTRRRVDLFGRPADVAFYNSFVATADTDRATLPGIGRIDVARDPAGEVHALRGPWFASVQFHPESVLTDDGPGLIAGLLVPALADPAVATDRRPTERQPSHAGGTA